MDLVPDVDEPPRRSRGSTRASRNGTLWPLYHDLVAKPEFHREWWDSYVAVNRRFAEKAAELAAEGATGLGPRLPAAAGARRCCASCARTCASASTCTSRSRRPSCSSSCRGAARSSRACSAPTWSASSSPARRRTSCAWSASGSATRPTATWSTCPTAARCAPAAFPISIDAAGFEELAQLPGGHRSARSEIREALGNPRKIFLGVDRLDYTKGIYARLRAYAELIEDGHLDVEDAVFVQVAVPSREQVEQYRILRDDIDRLVGRINGDLGQDRAPGDQLPALVLPARGDGRALPGRRHHGRHAATATA